MEFYLYIYRERIASCIFDKSLGFSIWEVEHLSHRALDGLGELKIALQLALTASLGKPASIYQLNGFYIMSQKKKEKKN